MIQELLSFQTLRKLRRSSWQLNASKGSSNMASDANAGQPTFKSTSLTADDLIRIFNDPEGELLNYHFKIKDAPKCKADDMFYMDVPYEAIKATVDAVRKQFFENFDGNVTAPAFEHAGSTSIKGTMQHNEKSITFSWKN